MRVPSFVSGRNVFHFGIYIVFFIFVIWRPLGLFKLGTYKL